MHKRTFSCTCESVPPIGASPEYNGNCNATVFCHLTEQTRVSPCLMRTWDPWVRQPGRVVSAAGCIRRTWGLSGASRSDPFLPVFADPDQTLYTDGVERFAAVQPPLGQGLLAVPPCCPAYLGAVLYEQWRAKNASAPEHELQRT